MTKDERIQEEAKNYASTLAKLLYTSRCFPNIGNVAKVAFEAGAIWAGQPQNVTDNQIMAVLNAIGYEERSWIEVVRKSIEQNN